MFVQREPIKIRRCGRHPASLIDVAALEKGDDKCSYENFSLQRYYLHSSFPQWRSCLPNLVLRALAGRS